MKLSKDKVPATVALLFTSLSLLGAWIERNRIIVVTALSAFVLLIVTSMITRSCNNLSEAIKTALEVKQSDTVRIRPAVYKPGHVEMGFGTPISSIESLAISNHESKPANKIAPVKHPEPAEQNSVSRYIARFEKVAKVEMQKFGIPASVTLAQGILESGVGGSEMARLYNNHFGIKCQRKGCSKGHCVNYHDDGPTDRFMVFESAWLSYRTHSLRLTDDRYQCLHNAKPCAWKDVKPYRAKSDDAGKWALAVQNWKNPSKRWAYGLDALGYATDPGYSKKILRVINSYNLGQYDK